MATLNSDFSVRQSSIALSENRIGRPGRPHGFDSQCICGSNHISSDPRRFSAALYSGQFVVRYFGAAGLGMTPIYPARFPRGIPSVSFATKPVNTAHGYQGAVGGHQINVSR